MMPVTARLFRGFLVFAVITAAASLILSRLARPLAIFEVLLIAILAGAPMVVRLRLAGVKALTEPLSVFSVSMFLFYVMRAAELLWRNSVPDRDTTLMAVRAGDGDLAVALAYVLIGFCAFHVAFRAWNPPQAVLSLRPRWESSRLSRVVAVGGLAACASTVAAIAVSGGISGAVDHSSHLHTVTAYINFHVIGVVGGMFLLGLVLRWGHGWILSGDPIGVTACFLIAPYLLVLVGGSFVAGGTLLLIPCGLMLPVIFYLGRGRVGRARRVMVTWCTDYAYPQPQRRSAMYVARGHQAVFVGWDRESRFRSSESIDGVECHYLMRGGGYHSLRAAVGLLRWMNRLFWLALRADIDAIHAFDLDTALPVALACRLRRLPLIYDVFDNYELRYRWPEPVRKCIAWIDGWVVRGSAAVIVQDENRIVGGIAAVPEKVTPIYPCPPDYGRPRYADGHEPFSVYAMGFLGTRRGLGLLLESAKALPHVRFLLAGNIHEPGLKSLAASLPNVRYSGYLSWVAATELAWESDLVFAFFDPSYEINRRAAPQKLYETMMVGRPVLINSETIRAAWVEREKIGFSCPYDAAALQAKLRELAGRRAECRARGERGRQLFEAEYNWTEMENRLFAVIQRAVPALTGDTATVGTRAADATPLRK